MSMQEVRTVRRCARRRSVCSMRGLAGGARDGQPVEPPQGTDDAILTFRVPNESATAAVMGLKIQFPLAHPIVLLNPEAGSGWQVQVVKSALPKPMTTDDGTFTSTVSEIDWSADHPGWAVRRVQRPGPRHPDRGLAARLQGNPDVRRRQRGLVDRGPEQGGARPAHPAPTITLTAPGGSGAAAADGRGASRRRRRRPRRGSKTQAIAALMLAGFAVVLALLAVWLGRPRFGRDPDRPGPETSSGAAE